MSKTPSLRRGRRKAAPGRSSRFVPALESLEDRLAPAVVTPFTPRFSPNDTGDSAIIGNTLMTAPASDPAAVAAQGGTGSKQNNNNFGMVHVDVDGNPGTFNSSRATLDLPDGASVIWAGLYW